MRAKSKHLHHLQRVSLLHPGVDAADALEEGDAECVYDAYGIRQGRGDGERMVEVYDAVVMPNTI